MNATSRFWYLPVTAFGFLALALWTTDPALATLCAGTAGLAIAGFVVLRFATRVRFDGILIPPPDADPLVVLTRSFDGGRFGREEVLSRLDGLDLAAGDPLPNGSAEREQLLTGSEEAFLDHVEARIDRLERAT